MITSRLRFESEDNETNIKVCKEPIKNLMKTKKSLNNVKH